MQSYCVIINNAPIVSSAVTLNKIKIWHLSPGNLQPFFKKQMGKLTHEKGKMFCVRSQITNSALEKSEFLKLIPLLCHQIISATVHLSNKLDFKKLKGISKL